MSIFHFSEFVVTSLIRPQNLSTDSFLLNHSKAYGIAAATSWIEYLLEAWLFPCKLLETSFNFPHFSHKTVSPQPSKVPGGFAAWES